MMNLYQQTKKIMGTDAVLTIATHKSNSQAQSVFEDLWRAIILFDKKFSRFRNDSQLTALNTQDGEWVDISREFYELLKASQKMSEETKGIFNPFILPALNNAGYKSSWAPTADTANPPDYSDRKVVDADNLQVEKYRAKIPSGTAIDLGGIGKGYLLDKLADIAEANEFWNYWFSLGGDILASGSDANDAPWQISIAKADQPNLSVATVTTSASNRLAITTSGITKRRGSFKGEDWHHIIDPGSGKPANTDVLTVSLMMSSAVHADVFASCLVSLGSTKAPDFIKNHNIHDALIQLGTKKSDSVWVFGSKFVRA